MLALDQPPVPVVDCSHKYVIVPTAPDTVTLKPFEPPTHSSMLTGWAVIVRFGLTVTDWVLEVAPSQPMPVQE